MGKEIEDAIRKAVSSEFNIPEICPPINRIIDKIGR
jgi:hypothetical protein